MKHSLLARALRQARELRQHDRWSRRDLEAHQAGALRDLRDFAVERSPFYARRHRGMENRPLHELPIITREELIGRVDDVVTAPDMRKGAQADAARALDRYRVGTTGGASGRPAMLLWNDAEWATMLASYARALEWACVPLRPGRPTRIALITSPRPSHTTALVTAGLAQLLVHVLPIDPNEPLGSMVARLEPFQPDVLVTYPSVARPLSELALAGRLGIRPRAVLTTAEVLTRATRLHVLQAFRVEPYDLYSTAETAGIAAECALHEKHLFEDLVIPEVVDRDGRAVPLGTPGSRVLVSVLFSRTMPLIRYEITDRIALRAGSCPCGRPFALLDRVDGRSEDHLPSLSRKSVRALN